MLWNRIESHRIQWNITNCNFVEIELGGILFIKIVTRNFIITQKCELGHFTELLQIY